MRYVSEREVVKALEGLLLSDRSMRNCLGRLLTQNARSVPLSVLASSDIPGKWDHVGTSCLLFARAMKAGGVGHLKTSSLMMAKNRCQTEYKNHVDFLIQVARPQLAKMLRELKHEAMSLCA